MRDTKPGLTAMNRLSRQEQQRQALHTFWRIAKLRVGSEAEVEASRKNAFNAATQANQAAKDEAATIIKNARSVQNKAYAELSLSYPSISRPKPSEVVHGADTDNPRADLEKSCDSLRSESGLLLEGIRLLDKHRENIARQRPIATCMTIIAVPIMVVVTLLGFLTFQEPVPGLMNTVVAIATEQFGIVVDIMATSIAPTIAPTQQATVAVTQQATQLNSGDTWALDGVNLTVRERANDTCGGFAFEFVIENTRPIPVSIYFELEISEKMPPQDGCYYSAPHQQNISVPAQQSSVYWFRDAGSTGPTTLSVTLDEHTAIWKLR